MRLAVAVLLMCTAVVHAHTPADAVGIHGRVVAAATDAPLRLAHVFVYGTSTRRLRVTTTDSDGRFQMADLPPDTYRVGVSRPPFLPVITDATAPELLFRLQYGAAIAGEVITDRGQPAAGTPIVVLSNNGHTGGRATTDTRGRYRIHSLAPGEFEVTAAGTPYGQPFTVVAGENRDGVNFTVRSDSKEPAHPPPTGKGRISGRAIDPAGGHPLAHTLVRLTGPGALTISADAQGRFEFPSLGPGTYSLRVMGPGAVPVGSAVVEIDLDANPITDVVLSGSLVGSLSGTVRDDTGDPIVGVAVTAFLQTAVGGVALLVPRNAGLTDDRGQYRIGGLPRGDYIVCGCSRLPLVADHPLLNELAPTPIRPEQVQAAMDPGTLVMPPAYHPGVRRATDSMTVLIAGDDRAGVDITMPLTTGYTVSGRIVGGTGVQSGDMAVRLMPVGDVPNMTGIADPAAMTLVNPDGRFTITRVPEGAYVVIAFARRGGASGIANVIVDRNVTGLVVNAEPNASVSGRVDFGPGMERPTPEQLTRTRVTLTPAELTPLHMFAMTALRQNWLTAEAAFDIAGVAPGRYRVSTDGPGLSWHSIAQVSGPSGIAPDHIITVEPGTTGRIVVTMSSDPPASLEGSVTLAKYEPPESLRVVAFTTAWRSRLDVARLDTGFGTQQIRGDGTFLFPTLEAGDYFVLAIPQNDLLTVFGRFADWERVAQRVTLRPGETTSLRIPLPVR